MKRDGKNNPYTIIVGCGRLGSSLAEALSDAREDVIIIDRDKNAFRKLDSSFGGMTLAADATDMDVLEEAGIGRASNIVIVTNNDNVNIMIAQLAKENYKRDKVICRLYDPEREVVYKALNIRTICPAILSAKAVETIIAGGKEAAI